MSNAAGLPESYKSLRFPPLEEFEPTQPVVHVLPNGLRIYLMEDHELPIVRMRAMVRAGSTFEPKDKLGLAAVCAQAIRTGGSLINSGDAIDDEFGAMGASLDVTIGGGSGTATASCLSEKLDRVFEVFADVLLHPCFPEDKIELAR